VTDSVPAHLAKLQGRPAGKDAVRFWMESNWKEVAPMKTSSMH
jgi:hypothetical protein